MRIIFYLTLFTYLDQNALALECPKRQHHVKAHYRSSYYRADGAFVSEAEVKEHCRANPPSYIFWQDKFKDVRPEGWPHKIEKTKAWTLEEKERVLEAICELPEELWKKSEYKIYRMDKSKDGGNPGTSSPIGAVVLYDSAFAKKYNLARVLAHEFAHEIYLKGLGQQKRKQYQEATGWLVVEQDEKDPFIITARKNGYTKDDGRSSPEEDFANNVEYYLFDKKELSKKTQNAFNWIQNHFNDSLKVTRCRK